MKNDEILEEQDDENVIKAVKNVQRKQRFHFQPKALELLKEAQEASTDNVLRVYTDEYTEILGQEPEKAIMLSANICLINDVLYIEKTETGKFKIYA